MESEKKGLKRYQLKKISKGALMFFLLSGFVIGTVSGYFVFLNSQNGVIKLTMVYSSEKEAWISATQPLFLQYWNQLRQQNPSLKPIELNFQPYGSGDSVIALLNGEVQTRNLVTSILHLDSNSECRVESIDAISNTATLRIIPKLFILLLLLPHGKIFYKHTLSRACQGLHDLIVQNPELVKMAHTDPRDSNSGFMAMIMLVSGFLNKDPTTISLNDLANSSLLQYIRDIEKSAIFYGTSTGYLGQYMLAQGPSALQVTFLYENLVQNYAQKALKQYGQKIVAVYPDEGSLYADHPFCILNANWISPDQQYVAQQYLNFISSSAMIKIAIQSGFARTTKVSFRIQRFLYFIIKHLPIQMGL